MLTLKMIENETSEEWRHKMTVLVRHKYGRFLRFLRQERAQMHFWHLDHRIVDHSIHRTIGKVRSCRFVRVPTASNCFVFIDHLVKDWMSVWWIYTCMRILQRFWIQKGFQNARKIRPQQHSGSIVSCHSNRNFIRTFIKLSYFRKDNRILLWHLYIHRRTVTMVNSTAQSQQRWRRRLAIVRHAYRRSRFGDPS